MKFFNILVLTIASIFNVGILDARYLLVKVEEGNHVVTSRPTVEGGYHIVTSRITVEGCIHFYLMAHFMDSVLRLYLSLVFIIKFQSQLR